jgi:tetratricopeptide (TPR) repeat protein
MPRQPLLKISAAAALLLLVVAAVLWRRPSAPQDTPAPAAEPTAAAPSNPRAAVAAQRPRERQPAQEQLPVPGCWDGLQGFDQVNSLEGFRAGLAAVVSAGDRLMAIYLQERLTELVGNDAQKALQVLEWAATSSQPELGVYMEALKAAPAVHDARVAEALLKLGEDKGADMVVRAAAMDTLETQRSFTPQQRQRVKALAMDPSADSAAWLATRTLGRVMKEDFERTGTFAPYWNDLMELGEKAEDTAVRLLALEMPSYSNPVLGEDSIERLGKVMREDREREVREMAAFRLAVTEEPEKALEQYRTAFEAEHDVCVRWAILRFAVRAAGAQALPTVQQFAAKDPRFAQDYQDFQQLYADGTTDFARIWMGKKEHHNCIVEEGAPH